MLRKLESYTGSDAPTCYALPDPPLDLRKRMNAYDKAKREKRHSLGLCRCGKPAADGVKMCPKCLGAAREASRNAYRMKKGIPLDAPVSKRGRKRKAKAKSPQKKKSSASLVKGIVRQVNRDGYGREDVWYVASLMVKGKSMARRWSVSKHGEDGARLAASLQKLLWVVENGLWKPEDGDPLAIMSYADSFNGNRDYDDCVVDDVSSPWIHEYEDED